MRRKRKPQDSLELFLDAVCNMFGGFIFILLFVVVSIRSTRGLLEKPVEPNADAAEIAALEAELDELKLERAEIVDSTRRLDELSATVEPEIADLFQREFEAAEKERETTEENRLLAATLERARDEPEKLETANRQAEQELAEAKTKLAESRRRLAEARRQKTRDAQPPQIHFSDKGEIPVVLKYGKLYFLKKPDAYGFVGAANDEDFFLLRKKTLLAPCVVAPKPNAGIDLHSVDVEAKLKTGFALCRPNRDKIVLIVCGDSYVEYGVARDFLKNAGFDLRPMIGAPGEKVFDRGGRNNEAQ